MFAFSMACTIVFTLAFFVALDNTTDAIDDHDGHASAIGAVFMTVVAVMFFWSFFNVMVYAPIAAKHNVPPPAEVISTPQ